MSKPETKPATARRGWVSHATAGGTIAVHSAGWVVLVERIGGRCLLTQLHEPPGQSFEALTPEQQQDLVRPLLMDVSGDSSSNYPSTPVPASSIH